MNKRCVEIAKRLREEPLYKTEGSGRLTCRNCNTTFKRARSRLSPCCPDCTQSLAERLAVEIIDDAELESLLAADEQRQAIDPCVQSPTAAQSGKRYIPMIPVVGVRDGWQIARGLGHKGSIIELMFEVPEAAQAHADRFMRGQGPGRVIEVDLVDALHLLATSQERYERVERLIFKYIEEEQRMRPVLQGQPEGKEKPFDERDMAALARLALAGPNIIPQTHGASPYRCRRCTEETMSVHAFCFKCMKVALYDLAMFVVDYARERTAV